MSATCTRAAQLSLLQHVTPTAVTMQQEVHCCQHCHSHSRDRRLGTNSSSKTKVELKPPSDVLGSANKNNGDTASSTVKADVAEQEASAQIKQAANSCTYMPAVTTSCRPLHRYTSCSSGVHLKQVYIHHHWSQLAADNSSHLTNSTTFNCQQKHFIT